VVTPAARRIAVGVMTTEVRISQRRACALAGAWRSTARYRSRRADPAELVSRLRELALSKPRWGYRLLGDTLRDEGCLVNHKRLYRIYKAEGLSLPRRRPKKLPRPRQPRLEVVLRKNQRWSMDFVSDAFAGGRRFRVLTMVDDATRECPDLLVDTSISGLRVTRVLDGLRETRGLPEVIVVDNGPEFTAGVMHRWARQNGVQLHFIDPGKPTQNAYVESFNGKFRDTCLNVHWFVDLEDARRTIEDWRVEYNEVRSHSSLGRRPPAVYARMLEDRIAAVETEETASRFPPSPQPCDEGIIPT
jgi:putative transposase